MTLNIMVAGQCFLFPLLHLLLSSYSIPLSSDTHTCSPVWLLQQLENQHLAFLWLNKAVVYICQSAHMDVLIFYGVGGTAVSGSSSSGFGNNLFYVP